MISPWLIPLRPLQDAEHVAKVATRLLDKGNEILAKFASAFGSGAVDKTGESHASALTQAARLARDRAGQAAREMSNEVAYAAEQALELSAAAGHAALDLSAAAGNAAVEVGQAAGHMTLEAGQAALELSQSAGHAAIATLAAASKVMEKIVVRFDNGEVHRYGPHSVHKLRLEDPDADGTLREGARVVHPTRGAGVVNAAAASAADEKDDKVVAHACAPEEAMLRKRLRCGLGCGGLAVTSAFTGTPASASKSSRDSPTSGHEANEHGDEEMGI